MKPIKVIFYILSLDQLTKSFNIRDKLHLQTLTPEIVLDFCEPLMQCASFYRSLKTFVERRVNLPFGPAHRVFIF